MRLEPACVMTPFATVHSATGTFHSSAAACKSIIRAVAPPLRTYSFDSRMPRLPPVEKLPQTRLRARFCPGVGYSVVTFAQLQSSSSATSCESPVRVPCPISERAIRMTTVSSGLMTTQALTSGATGTAWAAASFDTGRWNPKTTVPAAAAEPFRNLRRDTLFGAEVSRMMALMRRSRRHAGSIVPRTSCRRLWRRS